MKEPKKKRYKLTIQYYDPDTKEMGAVDILKSNPMTQEEWNKTLTRRLVEANLESSNFCYTVGTHRDRTVGGK